MTAEEKAIAEAVPPTVAFPQPLPAPDDKGRAIIRALVDGHKVAIVAMESCEFCWTIFKLLKAIGVEYAAARQRPSTRCVPPFPTVPSAVLSECARRYETLNFDALEHAPGNQGNIIRASVQEYTDCVTFPQVSARRMYAL